MSDVPSMALTWVQYGGGVAMIGYLMYLIVYFTSLHKAATHEPMPRMLVRLFMALGVLAGVCYVVFILTHARSIAFWFANFSNIGELSPPEQTAGQQRLANLALTIGGSAALIAVFLPFLVDLPHFRGGRIWAVAKLSFKEATRRRVLWVFAALLLVVLFGSWFLPYNEDKPENQVRNYVTVVYWAMTPLLLVVASMVAAFSLPTDIKQQTIHTILTKPVHRFEVILGRFVGYTLVFTLILVFMTGFSLIYVLRGVDRKAQEESFKARVPAYGKLEFEGTESKDRGENVGKEWDYRSYIAGPQTEGGARPPQFAIWSFEQLPGNLGARDKVRCEFNFDIYRTTKGEENRGVFCKFTAESWQWDPLREKEYKADRDRMSGTATENAKELALKYGYFEFANKDVVNGHTQIIDIPASVFQNHLQSSAEFKQRLVSVQKQAQPLLEQVTPLRERKKAFQDGKDARALPLAPEEEARLAALNQELEPLEHELAPLAKLEELEKKGTARPPIKIRVQCTSRTQFLGMAPYDLYLRLDDPDSGRDHWMFYLNFFKGAAGLWFRLCLVIGVSTAISTYLTGVISWLTTMFLYAGGLSRDFIGEVSHNKNIGGGPAESALRLIQRTVPAGEMEKTATVQVATGFDHVYRWLLKGILYLIPDVERFDMADRVREGFDISGTLLLTNFLYLASWLILPVLLAYYLMKSREVASG